MFVLRFILPGRTSLHTLHQGSLCAIAALLTDHFESKSPGLTLNQLEQFLLQAYKHYRVWCKEKKIAASSLKFNLSRFGRESWVSMPEVTTQYKASTVKYLQYWLYDFLSEEPGDIPSAQDRRHCSFALEKFQYMLDMHGEWFSQDVATRTAGLASVSCSSIRSWLCDPGLNHTTIIRLSPSFTTTFISANTSNAHSAIQGRKG